ncbi:MAG TPA: methyltransferase domain-containing protein [Gammaproteobacteria bacterium]|nr:methyltransferase domain-containing protein [Gammaproteobacteria bacterium]
MSQSLATTRATFRRTFLKNYLQDPIRVASVLPSGRNLARVMAAEVLPGSRVVELGVGTGTLTRALLDKGVDPSQLYLVEQNADFVQILGQQFPASEVLAIDAADLAEHLADHLGQIDYVVSGLPILWFSRGVKKRILAGAFSLLRRGGSFHQFSYFARPPVSQGLLEELGLVATRTGFAPLNVPPAFAYRFMRREDQ